MILRSSRNASAPGLSALLRVADLALRDSKAAGQARGTSFRLQLRSWVHAQAEDTQASDFEVCDTLKVIALVSHFRSRGHL
ncbi:hypothetical protein WJX84_001222, partial [Apatococcus fuscideae]